jgi:hypothetical protein
VNGDVRKEAKTVEKESKKMRFEETQVLGRTKSKQSGGK